LLFEKNGAHGMLFETLEGQKMLALHAPNDTPNEKAVFLPVEEKAGMLILKESI
jgi:arabinan endo-1,5-alpha-L-arabinosidase